MIMSLSRNSPRKVHFFKQRTYPPNCLAMALRMDYELAQKIMESTVAEFAIDEGSSNESASNKLEEQDVPNDCEEI